MDLQMRFACETLTDFLDQHAGDVSRGGIFVRTRELLAVGCPVNLNLQLGNGVTLLAGTATVFWTRANDPAGAESEPGMGLRFGRMTKHSQDVLSFILAEKARRERVADVADDGASEFDDVRTVVVPGDAPPAASDPEDGAGEFGDVRTVVAKEEAPPPAAGVVEGTASAEVEGAPAAAAAKDLQPPVASQSEAPPAPASARTPPPPASPAATPKKPASPKAAKAAKRFPRLGIGLAIGGLMMLSGWFAFTSARASRPAPGRPATAANEGNAR